MRETQAKAGRPRDVQLDDRLLEAARQVFLERGYQHASLSEVARRAGVGTPALYRRWRTKTEIAIDVFEGASRPDPIPDTGTIREDLVEFVKLRIRTFSTRIFHHVLLPVVLEASSDPELSAEIRRRFIQYRQPWMQARIGKAIAAGELRPDTDPNRLIDLLMGPVMMPLVFSQDLPSESDAAGIVDNLLDGFAAG